MPPRQHSHQWSRGNRVKSCLTTGNFPFIYRHRQPIRTLNMNTVWSWRFLVCKMIDYQDGGLCFNSRWSLVIDAQKYEFDRYQNHSRWESEAFGQKNKCIFLNHLNRIAYQAYCKNTFKASNCLFIMCWNLTKTGRWYVFTYKWFSLLFI